MFSCVVLLLHYTVMELEQKGKIKMNNPQKICGHCDKDLTDLDYEAQVKHVRECKGTKRRV